jgi:hypothetical protein
MIAAMSELVFSHGRLLQGQTELARVGIDASIAWHGRDYDVVRTKRRGWHYAIQARENQSIVCGFAPHRLRRGGRLRSASSVLELRGRPLRPTGWRLTSESGLRIDLSSKLDGSDPFKFRVLLLVEDGLALLPEPLPLLLACWLAVNWENAPTGPAEGATAGLIWGPGS